MPGAAATAGSGPSGSNGECTPKTERQSRELGDFRAGRAPRVPAAGGPRFRPERLTVAAWIRFTGLEATVEGIGPRELTQEELEESQQSEAWFAEPTPGTVHA